jgi:hypothetical protein
MTLRFSLFTDRHLALETDVTGRGSHEDVAWAGRHDPCLRRCRPIGEFESAQMGIDPFRMRITPKAIQDLLDELEASKQSRLRAWETLQEIRRILTNLGNTKVKSPSTKTFDSLYIRKYM